MDDDDEWEEEEQLVVVELTGIINTDFMSKCQGTCKIIDIDSEKPIMQVGQYWFAGEYEDALGTCVLFEEGQQKGKTETGPTLKYKCHTPRKLMMQRIFLTEKKEEERTSENTDCSSRSNTTCQPNLEEFANQQEKSQEEMENMDLQDSAKESSTDDTVYQEAQKHL